MPTVKAVPVGVLRDARGKVVEMEPGPCLLYDLARMILQGGGP